ncbi:MAG: MlaC/ttg2D family ABC transporter substrate-binding protein [Thermodesulfobacteriota bacterium]
MESVQATTERVVEILCDDALKGDSNRDKRKEMVSKTVKERFDWEAIARGALAAHWRDLDRTQQEEFTELFGALLERTYLEYLDEYSGEEEIVYVSEEMEGTRARVNGKFITRKKQEIPVEYRMRKRNGDWLISDVLVEGVSLVRNYRVQFNDIVSRSSYEDLVKRIKEKMEEDI